MVGGVDKQNVVGIVVNLDAWGDDEDESRTFVDADLFFLANYLNSKLGRPAHDPLPIIGYRPRENEIVNIALTEEFKRFEAELRKINLEDELERLAVELEGRIGAEKRGEDHEQAGEEKRGQA